MNQVISEEWKSFSDYVKSKEDKWIEIYNELMSNKKDSLVLTKWPLFIMLLGGITCLGMSATFHLFIAHSHKVNNLFNRLDYAGIALLIVGSSYPPNYYLFYCKFSKFI